MLRGKFAVLGARGWGLRFPALASFLTTPVIACDGKEAILPQCLVEKVDCFYLQTQIKKKKKVDIMSCRMPPFVNLLPDAPVTSCYIML